MIPQVLLFCCLIQLNQGLYENHSFINGLDSVNLKNRILLEKYVLVNFYTIKCNPCVTFQSVYALIGEILKEMRPDIYIGSLNCNDNAKILREYDIPNIPSVKLFNGKQAFDYQTKQMLLPLLKEILEDVGEDFIIIHQSRILQQIMEIDTHFAVGFFKNISGIPSQIFQRTAKLCEKLSWVITTSENIFKEYSVEVDDHIIMFRQFDEPQIDFKSNFTEDNVKDFLLKYSYPLLSEFNEKKRNVPDSFNFDISYYLMCLLDEKHKKFTLHKMLLQKSAKSFLGKVKFIFSKSEDAVTHYLLGILQLSKEEIPTYRLIKLFPDYQTILYKPNDEKMTSKRVISFVQSVIDGVLQPHYKSEKLHQRWNKYPVKVLVGDNYDDVTQDENIAVFVLLCSEKCNQCVKIRHIWHNLGLKYKDQEDIWIATIDIDKNDIKNIRNEVFPKFLFYPKGSKSMIIYNGDRTIDEFKLFLDSNGTYFKTINYTKPEESRTKSVPNYVFSMPITDKMPAKDLKLIIEEI